MVSKNVSFRTGIEVKESVSISKILNDTQAYSWWIVIVYLLDIHFNMVISGQI